MPIIDTIHRGNSYPKCIRDPKPPDDLNLRKMLHYLKSFPVIVDPKDSEYRKDLYGTEMGLSDLGNGDRGGTGMNREKVDKWLEIWDERIDKLIKSDPPSPGESTMEYYANRIVREEDREWFRDWWKRVERLTNL
jgi:hypothetical protein